MGGFLVVVLGLEVLGWRWGLVLVLILVLCGGLGVFLSCLVDTLLYLISVLANLASGSAGVGSSGLSLSLSLYLDLGLNLVSSAVLTSVARVLHW